MNYNKQEEHIFTMLKFRIYYPVYWNSKNIFLGYGGFCGWRCSTMKEPPSTNAMVLQVYVG